MTPDALARFSLADRVVIVTGASSGLGAEVARACAQAGGRVAVVARRVERLGPLAEEIGGVAVGADLTDPDQVDAVVPRVVEALGAPAVLVNVAGGFAGATPAETESLDQILETLQLNLVAPFRLAQAVFPYLRDGGGGSIVNVSSISGKVGIPSIPQASYAASKGGLSGLTVELAVQWARHSVRINTVAPGFFRSEITADLFDGEKGQQWLRRNTPLPYDADTADFVGMVLLLASDAGRFITGQTLVVDGGWTAR